MFVHMKNGRGRFLWKTVRLVVKLALLESDTERAQLVKSARANLTSVR